MASIKINELEELNKSNDEDLLVIVDSVENMTKKIKAKNLGVGGGSVPTGDTLPIGAIMPYTSKTTPSNWLPCNGQAVSRTTYADLFAIIGEQYGSGDGSTTFNVPDLNDYKVPIGYDRFEEQSSRMNLGTTGGEETHKLTIDEMPSHAHSNKMFTMNAIDNNYGFAQGGSYADRAVGRADTSQYNVLNGEQNIQNTGGSQPHNNMQPYVTTNYIIKAFQSSGVVGNVVNEKTTSDKDTYSCDYINKTFSGITLYENSTGELDNITLNDSAANYNSIEIEFVKAGTYGVQKVINPNGKQVTLYLSNWYDTGSLQEIFKKININGTTITHLYGGFRNSGTSGTPIIGIENSVSITKVIGYK